jgi:hypothetical protein
MRSRSGSPLSSSRAFVDRFAVLARVQHRALIDAFAEAVEPAPDRLGARAERERGPRRLRGLGRGDDTIDVGRCAAHDRPDDFLGVRRPVDPCAVNVQLRVGARGARHLHRHGVIFQRI